MNHLAATAEQAGSMSRAEAYLRAGEQWLLADEPEVAADRFEQAMADGGETFAKLTGHGLPDEAVGRSTSDRQPET